LLFLHLSQSILIFQEIILTKNIEVIRDCRKTEKERKTRNAIPII